MPKPLGFLQVNLWHALTLRFLVRLTPLALARSVFRTRLQYLKQSEKFGEIKIERYQLVQFPLDFLISNEFMRLIGYNFV